MKLHPDERCSCARPLPSGRVYFAWKHCTRCGRLIPRTESERIALDAEERRLEAAHRDRETLTDAQVELLLRRELRTSPDLSITDLRFRVSCEGAYRAGDGKFSRLVGEAKDELLIERAGGARRAS